MAQIGLFSSVLFLLIAFSSIFIFRIQVWKSLLISSIFTLGIFMPFTLVFLLLGTAITYQIGNKIQSSFPLTGLGIGILIGFLIVYKIKESWIDHFILLDLEIWEETGILQIVGLSFFVFNAISYLMDIKKRFITPADSFFKLMLYLLYFPTLHAGPLHRFTYLSKQFDQSCITEKSVSHGMRLMLWGLFKNLVLAQRLSHLFFSLKESDVGGWWTLLIGFVFFFYLYFSFSSFVDFFHGISEIFGIRLKDNFHKRVYFSTSRHEFWKGWHITLNEWFRDYFFYWQIKFKFWVNKPYILLLMTYLLIGLWHGISWKYLVWGGVNGAWILIEKSAKMNVGKKQSAFYMCTRIAYHLIISSFFALVFTFSNLNELWLKFMGKNYFPWEVISLYKRNIYVILLAFIIVDLLHIKSNDQRIDMYFETLSPWRRRAIYLLLSSSIILFGVFYGGLDNYYLRF